jgi:tRNA nucleotidyltransferase (CCA-adding enzyme)
MTPTLPPRHRKLRQLATAIRDEGGRAYLVGGAVRDLLMDRPVKDLDVEVFGLTAAKLEPLLAARGKVNAVGRAFGVFKVRLDGVEVDVSLPRRDSKVGPGHRGIAVEGDPTMTVLEAALRRDLTVNAILLDLDTGAIEDPVDGVADLRAGLLRAVDPATFLEDPLRAVRVAQFAARLGFAIDPSLVDLCARAPLDELPPERIWTEWHKLLIRADTPSSGLAFLRRARLLPRLFPLLVDDPSLDAAVDRAVAARRTDPEEGRRVAIPLVAWLAATPGAGVTDTLDRLSLHRLGGYPVRDRVVAAHAALRDQPAEDADLRRLSTRGELYVRLYARPALVPRCPHVTRWAERIDALGIRHAAPPRLVLGRDLLALGLSPGPAVGAALEVLYDRQLAGDLPDRAAALREAQRMLIG